jgi:HK97 family phage portal protein
MTSLLGRATRALTASSFWGYNVDYNTLTHAGVVVDQDTASRHSAVWGALSLLSDDISTLPLKAFRDRAGVRQELPRQPAWLRMPDPADPNITLVEYLHQVVLSVLTDGNAFIHVAPNLAAPAALTVLPPTRVRVSRGPGGAPRYKMIDQYGQSTGDLDWMEIVHITWMRKPGALRGLSPIESLAESIGSGLAAEQFSSLFYSNGANMSGVIETPQGSSELSSDQVTKIKQDFRKGNAGLRNSHAVGILTSGAKFHEMTVKPSDALIIDAQKWSVEQVARAFKIPPHMLGSQEGRSNAYRSVEQKSQDYVTHAVAPLCTRIEKALSRILPNGSFVEFDLRGLLRAAAADRADYYAKMIGTGSMSPNMIAMLENYPTFDGGDKHYLPVNNLASIDELAADEQGEPPNPNEPEPSQGVAA